MKVQGQEFRTELMYKDVHKGMVRCLVTGKEMKDAWGQQSLQLLHQIRKKSASEKFNATLKAAFCSLCQVLASAQAQ